MISHSKNKYQIPLLFTFKMNRELCNMNLTTFTRSLIKKTPPKNSGQLFNHFVPLFPVNRFAQSSLLLYMQLQSSLCLTICMITLVRKMYCTYDVLYKNRTAKVLGRVNCDFFHKLHQVSILVIWFFKLEPNSTVRQMLV